MDKIIPKCKNGEMQFISSDGRWFPCCNFINVGKHYKHSIFAKDEYKLESHDKFIDFHQLDSFLLWLEYIENFFDNAPPFCKRICSKKSIDVEQNTENMGPYQEELFYINNKQDLDNFLLYHKVDD